MVTDVPELFSSDIVIVFVMVDIVVVVV